jgi:hypothetical protein
MNNVDYNLQKKYFIWCYPFLPLFFSVSDLIAKRSKPVYCAKAIEVHRGFVAWQLSNA